MKKILLLIFVCVSILSCLSDSPEQCYNIHVNNNTKFNLKIEAYNSRKLLKSFSVEPQKRFAYVVNQKYGSILGVEESSIDSVNFIFDDTKIIVQYCNGKDLSFCQEIEKNLDVVYAKQVGGNFKTNFLNREKCVIRKEPIELNIDQSDYDRAVPIKK